MKRSRGLTLLESLLITFILVMVLGMVATLAGRYRHAALYSAQKDKEIQGAQFTLGLLRKELLAAYKVISPDPADLDNPVVDALEFQRVDPNAARLPDPPLWPGPPGGAWDPFHPDTSAQVKYHLEGEQLMRDVTIAGVMTPVVVGDGFTDFGVGYLSNRNLEISLSVDSSTRQITLRTRLFRGHRDEP